MHNHKAEDEKPKQGGIYHQDDVHHQEGSAIVSPLSCGKHYYNLSDHQPNQHRQERNEGEEPLIVPFAYTVAEPGAVVIEFLYANIALEAVYRSRSSEVEAGSASFYL